jgi:hypothetical protein
MRSDLKESRLEIQNAERRFDAMRQLVEAKGYDWDMIDLKHMQRKLDDLIKRYEDKVTKLTGQPYRYSSTAVAPLVDTHPFIYHHKEDEK